MTEPVRGIPSGPWLGSPANALPGIAPLRFVLAKTESLVLTVSSVRAYRSGFEFTLGVRVRDGSDAGLDDFLRLMHRPTTSSGELHPSFLRLGLEYPDGGKATNVTDIYRRRLALRKEEAPPHGPGLQMGGGQSDSFSGAAEAWAWPLPSKGPLSFVCEWPARALPLTKLTVDGSAIVEASTHSRLLWGDTEEWFGLGSGVMFATGRGTRLADETADAESGSFGQWRVE